jgi:putative membrane protein
MGNGPDGKGMKCPMMDDGKGMQCPMMNDGRMGNGPDGKGMKCPMMDDGKGMQCPMMNDGRMGNNPDGKGMKCPCMNGDKMQQGKMCGCNNGPWSNNGNGRRHMKMCPVCKIIAWVVGIIILLLIICFACRCLHHRKAGWGACKSEAALDILKKRYASGEVTKEDFDRIKKDLES